MLTTLPSCGSDHERRCPLTERGAGVRGHERPSPIGCERCLSRRFGLDSMRKRWDPAEVRGVVYSHSTVAEPRKRKKDGEEEGFEESLKVLSHQQRSKW